VFWAFGQLPEARPTPPKTPSNLGKTPLKDFRHFQTLHFLSGGIP
jgi:hypothetical protein